jgi:hypothetical protein
MVHPALSPDLIRAGHNVCPEGWNKNGLAVIHKEKSHHPAAVT